MRRKMIQHHHLSGTKRWTQLLAHIPLENLTIERTVNDQRGHWPRQAQCTNQALIVSVVARNGANRTEVPGCAGIPARHVGLKAALIEKDQPLWMQQVRFEIVQESRALILTSFEGDQRFFYG